MWRHGFQPGDRAGRTDTWAARSTPSRARSSEGPEFNELDYAREVAAHCGAESHSSSRRRQEFCDLLPKLVYHMDEPVAGPGLFPQYIVSRMAPEQVKVCLGGQGGDEIFGGYARYLVAYFEQALKGAIFETNEERGAHRVARARSSPNLAALKQYVPLLKRVLRTTILLRARQQYFRLVDRSEGAIGPPATTSVRTTAATRVPALHAHVQRTGDVVRTTTSMPTTTCRPALQSLLQVEDRVSMAVSLESRVPLLDSAIVELVASMPPAMKFRAAK